ncbi:MAG: NAD(P)-binding domain-containing protein [Actinobacteria bacterium]|nr:NAD(P)-binding domain-containing protein [Actinomycetota bacterium]
MEGVDAVIVGAGPYGLSLAAHLRRAGVSHRQFGHVMHPWRTAMPQGMFLKSQGFASSLSDPDGTHTLAAFCARTGRPYATYGLPVPLDTFVAYGQWFAREQAPDLEQTLVTSVTQASGGFEVELESGDRVRARSVVVAAGIEHFARTPAELADLPAELCSHSSQHPDLSVFAGRTVAVLGAGQSALESAALLHEQGASVTLIARTQQLAWNGAPLDPDRPLLRRLREPEAELGSGWGTWFYSRHPDLFRHLPERTRVYRARTALGPAGASWLRPRVEGKFPVLTGCRLDWAKPDGDAVCLGLTSRDGSHREVTADHVIAATGYQADLGRLAFLGEPLRSRLGTVAGTPAVSARYESTVPGLYFAGPAVAPVFGPVMRFVCGSAHPAAVISRRLAGTATASGPARAAGR